jgi:hypothetical protein
MLQQCKEGRVSDHESLPYNSLKLLLLANGDRFEVDYLIPIHFLLSGKALYPFEILLLL